jgi:aurora kinase
MAGPPWPSSPEELQLVKRLGQGYFGEVWKCRQAGSEAKAAPFAVKKVPLDKIRQHKLTEQMDREIGILRSLRHPRIVELFFDLRDSEHVYLGMELAEGGGMFDLLSRSGRFCNELAAQYFYEVCDALRYLHSLPEKVIHRDIKPENILLDKEGHVKLADFGWSNVIEGSSRRATFCGTPDYLAPEMIRGEGHDESLDMWEMGVLLYEMLVGRSPFGASKQETTCRNILQVSIKFPDNIDPDAKDLVLKLCRLRPQERLTAGQAMEHPFVAKYFDRPAAADETEAPESLQRIRGPDQESLQGEMILMLQAKSVTEQKLLYVTEELAVKHEELKREQRLRREAEGRFQELKDREKSRLCEVEEMRSRYEALAAEAERLRGAPTMI